MLPVPSYELIPFLAWLHGRGFRLSGPQTSERLRELALEFLRRGGYSYESLGALMAIFQDCPMIGEPNIEAQMDHFAGCGLCIEHIRERGPMRRLRGDRLPVHRHPVRDTGALHPLLRGFVAWAQDSELEEQLQELQRLRGPRFDQGDRAPDDFRHAIHRIGGSLRQEFRRYLSDVYDRDPELIDSFFRWRREQERGEPGLVERPDDDEDGTAPLGGYDESIDAAARRLAVSVRLAIEAGFYDSHITEEPQLARLMSSLAMETPENLAQTLEFISWLRAREPDLRLTGSIPAVEIENLALQFCEDRGYSNGRSFSKEAKRWLTGAGSPRAIDRIAKFLGIARWARLPDGQPVSYNPLDRYGAVRFHGLFLFLSSGDFPSFIEAHWRDLHHLTGDHLDIYFSQRDLTDRTSGYEVAAKLRSAPLRADALPALLLWEDRLDASVTIPLQGLEHSEVVEVVKAVVQGIRDGSPLDEIAKRGAARAASIKGRSGHSVVVQSGATLLINNGGVVGDIYKNEGGVVGAMGAGAVAHDNVFVQDATKLLSEFTISAEDAAVIARLAEALAGQRIEGVTLPERIEGARQLAALAEAAAVGRSQEVSVAGWRKWLATLGQRSEKVLSVLANVATIATPIAKLLGLPL